MSNLSTLSSFVAGPNSVKVATPLKDIEAQGILVNKAYLVSCTNIRSIDIANAARVFRGVAKDGVIPKIYLRRKLLESPLPQLLNKRFPKRLEIGKFYSKPVHSHSWPVVDDVSLLNWSPFCLAR